VVVAGEAGYVLDEARIERYRHGWSLSHADEGSVNFQLNDAVLATFPMFRGPETCADRLLDIVKEVRPSTEDDLTVAIFKRRRKQRRSWLDDIDWNR
jgi:hypothetical protein